MSRLYVKSRLTSLMEGSSEDLVWGRTVAMTFQSREASACARLKPIPRLAPSKPYEHEDP